MPALNETRNLSVVINQPPIADDLIAQRHRTYAEWSPRYTRYPDKVDYDDFTGEANVTTRLAGRTALIFNVELNELNNNAVILGPEWPTNSEGEELEGFRILGSYQEGFKMTFKSVLDINPDTKKIVFRSNEPDVSDWVLLCGRPSGWNRSFVNLGSKVPGMDAHYLASEDEREATHWLDQGDAVEIIFNRPLLFASESSIKAKSE